MQDVPVHKEYGCDGGKQDEPEPQEDVNLPEREINKSSFNCQLLGGWVGRSFEIASRLATCKLKAYFIIVVITTSIYH